MEDVKEFLIRNGFKQLAPNTFENNKCQVDILDNLEEVEGCYSIIMPDEDGFSHTMFSSDLNIYWLIGVLTYNGLMDKNYIQ